MTETKAQPRCTGLFDRALSGTNISVDADHANVATSSGPSVNLLPVQCTVNTTSRTLSVGTVKVNESVPATYNGSIVLAQASKYCDNWEGRSKIQTNPLATKILLEDTDGLRRPPSSSKGGDAIHQCPLDAVALCFC